MRQIQHTAIIGAGSWGTALAALLTQNCPKVTLVTRSQHTADHINTTHQNPKYLAEHLLPTTLRAVARFDSLREVDCLVLAVPSAAFRETLRSLAACQLPGDLLFLSVTKGIERDTGLRMTEIIREYFPHGRLAALSGPNHAEEVILNLPTCSVIGSSERAVQQELQSLFSTPTFRSYTSDDLIGIEWGGAVKNPYAIAAGIAKGLALGDNAIAALVTRALAEMKRIGKYAGAQPETFSGLSGVGDLMTTCYSPHSRNHQVGLSLARGLTVQQATQRLGMVAEGVLNTLSIHQKATALGVDAPLMEAIHAVLYEGRSPANALEELFQREPKPEL